MKKIKLKCYKITKKYQKKYKKLHFFNKNYNFLLIFDEFLFWILGLEEDDPLPYETNFVYFVIAKTNKVLQIFYVANEHEANFNFDYFPLEAQFFNCKSFNNIEQDVNNGSSVKLLMQIMVLRALKNSEFSSLFRGKKLNVIIS